MPHSVPRMKKKKSVNETNPYSCGVDMAGGEARQKPYKNMLPGGPKCSEEEQVWEWEWRGMELTMVTCSFRQSQSVQGSPL